MFNNIWKHINHSKKFIILKIIIGMLFWGTGLFIKDYIIIKFVCFGVSYIILGLEIAINAFKNIKKKNILDENILMLIATLGAFLIGAYSEGVAVVLFYQIGEFFNSYAVERSKQSVEKITQLRPDYVNLMVDNRPEKRKPETIEPGDIILIKPGEKIPLDCIVQDGNSSIDNSVLTGESVPVNVKSGDEILSGGINLTGTLIAKVKSIYSQSTVSRILELVRDATDKKSHTEKFITKFAKFYTPIIIISALIIAIFPPLIFHKTDFYTWIYRALVFLVISCPCALIISIPLGFFCGIGLASKKGILIKGSSYIEGLSMTNSIVFDKTGTLTKGIFAISKIVSIGIDKDKFLELAYCAELHSSHPIALSIKRFYDKDIDESRIQNLENIAGYGVKATVDGKNVHLGSEKFMESIGTVPHKLGQSKKMGSVVHMALDNKYAGYLIVSDKIKEDSFEGIKRLFNIGITNIAMLTGDSKEIGEAVAHDLGIPYVATELLPEEKGTEIKKLKNEFKTGTLSFVGDGINDAPALASSDIGIAMGFNGADAAVETADVVIMDDSLTKISEAISISKFTMRIVKQNIVFSLGIKFTILLLGILGFSSISSAVFADVGVSALVILNSARILKKHNIFSY